MIILDLDFEKMLLLSEWDLNPQAMLGESIGK